MSGQIECLKCGMCCRKLIVQVQHLDVLREPKLAGPLQVENYQPPPFDTECELWGKEYVLVCGESKPCIFLKDNQCEIYPTRPNICVAMEPGDRQCKFARGEGPLIPKSETMEMF